MKLKHVHPILCQRKAMNETLKQKKMINQFIRFGLVGVANTMHYYVWYAFFYLLIDMPYLFAHVIAFIISMIGSFYMNCYFTYKIKPTLKKFLQFPLTYIVNIGGSSLFLLIMVDIFSWSEVLSPFIAQCLTIPITFILSKLILDKSDSPIKN